MRKYELAALAGVSRQHLSQVLNGRAQASATLSRRLEHVTGIDAHIWAFGTPVQKQTAVWNFLHGSQPDGKSTSTEEA